MKILHVLDSLDLRYGGPVRAVMDLSSRALDYGLESEFAAFSAPHAAQIPANAHVFKARTAYRHAIGWRAWLRNHLGHYDGVVLHTLWLNWEWAAAEECSRIRIPYACFPHGMLEPWSVRGQGFGKRLKKSAYWFWRERRILAGARCVFFTTRREKRLAAQTFRLPPVSLEVIPYGADIPLASTSLVPPSQIADLVDKQYALFLGRVHPKKNPDLLLRAWALGAPADWHLAIAGPADPAYAARLARLATELRLSRRVRFIDFVEGDTKSWLMSRAKWFLLPSSQENFGVAVLEALRHGCPAAVSDEVALAEEMPAITPVIKTRTEDWAKFFREHLSDEPFRQSVQSAQQIFARDRFDMNVLAKGWTDTLKRVFT